MCSMTLPQLSLQTKSFGKNGSRGEGQETLIQTQNRPEHPDVIPSSSDQQVPIPNSTKSKGHLTINLHLVKSQKVDPVQNTLLSCTQTIIINLITTNKQHLEFGHIELIRKYHILYFCSHLFLDQTLDVCESHSKKKL